MQTIHEHNDDHGDNDDVDIKDYSKIKFSDSPIFNLMTVIFQAVSFSTRDSDV